MQPLPVDAALPELVAALASGGRAVLVAPPGAGKTLRVPPALIPELPPEAPRVLVLEPRRVAARAAARRVAAERGWRVGGEVGYQVRFQTAFDDATALVYVTEGILTRRLQGDPFLSGVGAVVLDEFHERSVHVDLALALLAEVQREVRPDLRLVVMSATLDAAPVSDFLGGCPIVHAPGQQHPVRVSYLPTPDPRDPALVTAAGVRRAIGATDDDGGDILAFLPGAAEIRRTADRLAAVAATDVLTLHGDMPADEQDRALAPGPRRRIILATNVAESSLTVPGVTTVVDAGWVKELRHDPRSGLDRLERRRVSQASAEQRAGRAGRLGPGRALRLWTAGEHHALAPYAVPEIRRVDLAPVLLEILAWGGDPDRFGWFEPPPATHLARARELLVMLGALDERGLTPHGRALAAFPLHPRLAAILAGAAARGCLSEGALLAALIAERDVLAAARAFGGAGGVDPAGLQSGRSDLLVRLERVRQVERLGVTPVNCAALGLLAPAVRGVLAVASQLRRRGERELTVAPRAAPSEEVLLGLPLCGFPDRVAARRTPRGDQVQIVGGRAAQLSPSSVVRDADLLLALVVDDGPRGRAARVRVASAITRAQLVARYPEAMTTAETLRFDPDEARVVAIREVRYRGLVLEQQRGPVTDRDAAGAVLAAAIGDPRRALGLDADPEVQRWLARVAFLTRACPELGLPPFDDEGLARLLPELCYGLISVAELRARPLGELLRAKLDRAQAQALSQNAPDRIGVPSGREVRLQYPAEGPPVLAVKLQEMFGLTETPRVASGRVPVLLHLLAPNQRPVQVTQDLESFWRRTYPAVRAELRGRYPKHPWPEDPMTAPAQRGTKGRRGRS